MINQRKEKAAVIIPAHNEETIIGDTVRSLLKTFDKKDIYFVSDGSTDKTVAIARRHIPNILNIKKNKGKAEAMNLLVKRFNLTKKYQYLMTVDSDTQVNPDFVKEALSIFKADRQGKIACVAGKVEGKKYNWLTYYRLWEYEIFQTIHKTAQSIESAVTVCPGCGTIYRSSIFKTISIPGDTVTEDMDLTLLIHRQNLGKIVYCPKATVITQDPKNLKDFVGQVSRWYTGFWQCISKYQIPWGGQMIDAELALLGLEGLFSSLVYITLLIFIPFALLKVPLFFAAPFLVDFLFFLPTLIMTAKRRNAKKIFFYLPHFYFLRIISNFIYLQSFLRVTFSFDRKMKWYKIKRYQVSQKKWLNPSPL